MNYTVAARETAKLLPRACNLPLQHAEFGLDHIQKMLWLLETDPHGDFPDTPSGREKAARWLGWAQCAIVMGGGASLDDMKEINRLA